MKKYSTILFLLLITQFFAQAPQKMSYQAVLRNANNDLITNTTVGMRISILQGSTSGTSVYVETQNPTTNANGLVSLEIGTGTSVTGTFATINWANGPFYIKTETAPSGGTNYTITGTNQLLSVPYALYAESSKQQGKTTIILADDITDAQAAAQISKELGPNTENIIIRNTTQLTSVDFSNVTSLIKIEIDNNSLLNSVNFNSLIKIYDFLQITNTNISSINFPSLVSSGSIVITENSNLNSISFPLLSIYGNANGAVFDVSNNSLISLNIPSISSLVMGIVLLPNFRISGNNLSSSTVNALLNKFLTVNPLSGKNLLLDGQNPPDPPTGQGIIDKTTLINMGNTVTTD